MPTPTYTPLANITLGSAAASVTFSSISQAYRDLVLVAQVSISTGMQWGIRFNSDSGANYPYVVMNGDGGSAGSAFSGGDDKIYGPTYMSQSATSASVWTANIMDYSATNKHKTVLSRFSQASNMVEATASRWSNTSAVTTVTFVVPTGTYSAGSTFALYGVAA